MKLWTLVGALMFVLFMMNEARKPENWRWMGFDEEGKQKKKEEDKKFIFEEAQYDSDNSTDDSDHLQPQKKERDPKPELDTESSEENSSLPQQAERHEDVSLAQPEFWKQVYRKLNLSEQRELFSLLRSLRARSFDGESQPDSQSLVKKIERSVKFRLSEMLNDLAMLAEGVLKREVLNRDLQEFQHQWERQIEPAMSGNSTLDDQQKAMIESLQLVFDEAAFAVVNDYTSPTKATDDPAWLRTWEKIVFSEKLPPGKEVKLIQLVAEADFYRGKRVSMQGELEGIEVLPTRANPIGTEQFYSVWIRPDSTPVQPFNVYLLELPAGIELSENRYTAFEDLQVAFDAYFFKVRTYKNVERKISTTPLLLAKSMKIVEVDPAEVAPVTVRSGWTPSRGVLIAFFVGMPLLAAGIAFWIFRGTTSRRLRTGATMALRINESLDELSGDTRVETVEEKLLRMEQEGLSR